jgi:hypothetical protein
MLFSQFPMTMGFSAWYSGIGLAGLALLPGFVLYAFPTSLGGHTLISRSHLDN